MRKTFTSLSYSQAVITQRERSAEIAKLRALGRRAQAGANAPGGLLYILNRIATEFLRF